MKILPCPFCCGDEMEIGILPVGDGFEDDEDEAYVECFYCGYRAPHSKDEVSAIMMHNMLSRQINKINK